MASSTAPADNVIFRPRKKRMVYKQRTSSNEEAASMDVASPPEQSLDELIAQAGAGTDAESAEVPISEIIRLRKLRKPKAGVEFKAQSNMLRDEDGQLVRDETSQKDAAIARFAAPAGHVADVNKHMMAYIDSQIEKRRAETLPKFVSGSNDGPTISRIEAERKKEIAERSAEQVGKLMEVDLGEEARLRNVEMTERARKRLAGEPVHEEPRPPPKIRLGPDGKPWRNRRKEKNEEDVRRDKMVEDIMKETRLDHYEEPAPEPLPNLDDGAADDRIADAFKRDFMSAIQKQRTAKVKPPATTTRGVDGKALEELKGPKLGGSRSARAAMRDKMLKEASTKK